MNHMDRRIFSYLQTEGIASLMNATKWRELATCMQGIKQGRLLVRVKYLLDDEPSGFACLDWEWVKHGDASVIEWLEIDPVFRTFQGRLIQDKAEDLAAVLKTALRAIGLPCSAEGGRFRVWGYVRLGACPEFM